MRRLGSVLTCALLLVAACGDAGDDEVEAESTPEAQTYEVTATIAAPNLLASLDRIQGKDRSEWPTCDELPGSLSGLQEGRQATLQSGGEIVSLGELQEPQLLKIGEESMTCFWSVDFADVPQGGKFYSAHILDWSSDSVREDALGDEQLIIYAED